MINESLLENEVETVWFYDPQIFPFVRELVMETSRRKPPKSDAHAIVVGYCPRKCGGERIDYFRWFTVTPYDLEPNATQVCEAVDPLTVSAGVPGCKTWRRLTEAQAEELAKLKDELREQQRKPARDRQRKCRDSKTRSSLRA